MKWLLKSVEFDWELNKCINPPDLSKQLKIVNEVTSVPWVGKSPDDVADKIYAQYGYCLKAIECIPIKSNKLKGFGKD
jgi:hypothetical protein